MIRLFLCLLLFPSLLFAFCFDEAGREFRIDPFLLESIARVESGMDPKAIHRNRNGSSDLGLMQINSSWIRTLGLSAQDLISDPCLNTMTGARILRQCINAHSYTWEAVGCYNAVGKQKRVGYAWKVFQKMSEKRPAATLMDNASPIEKTNSLFFAVRENSPTILVEEER